MKQETRYSYEKRIKALEQQNNNLQIYKCIYFDILNVALDAIDKNQHVTNLYIIRQAKRVMK